MKFTIVAVLFAITLAVYGKPQKPTEDVYGELRDENSPDDKTDLGDYGEMEETDSEEESSPPDETPPKILSSAQNVIASKGENITLHCNVSNMGGAVILWKKDGHLIYQASTKFGNNMLNTRVENDGQSFLIFHINEENVGMYECSILISPGDSLSLQHTVHVKMSPVITSLTSETNQTVFDVGESMHLICKATGYPVPIISWYTGKDKLDITGERLTIDSMKLKDAGNYRCMADNKSERPAHEAISVHVNHKPIISVDKFDVNSDNNLDVELKCQFHGYPAPTVIWQKDGANIHSVGNYNLKKEGHNLILTIRNAAERDFGTYTCSAKNSFGKSEKSRRVVKTPAIVHVDSKKAGKDFKVTFKVQSKSEISKHDLQYRKKGESEWNNVSPQVMQQDSENVYSIEYLLKNLEAGVYETRARSQNTHGWSEFSDVHEFSAHDTNTPAPHQETMQKETHLGASMPGSSAMTSSSCILISIALLSSLW